MDSSYSSGLLVTSKMKNNKFGTKGPAVVQARLLILAFTYLCQMKNNLELIYIFCFVVDHSCPVLHKQRRQHKLVHLLYRYLWGG